MIATYSFLLGILTKCFDDVVDLKLPVGDLIQYSLQSVIVLFMTLVSYQDMYFSYACLFVVVLNSGFDHPFWKSFLPLTILFCVINLPWRGDHFILKLILSTIGVLSILGIAYLEDKYFPEEYSIRKIISRILAICVFLSGLIIIQILPFPRFSHVPIQKTIYLMTGYLLTSILFQCYSLAKETDAFAADLGRGTAVPRDLVGPFLGVVEEEDVRERAKDLRGAAERAEEADATNAGGSGAPMAVSHALRKP